MAPAAICDFVGASTHYAGNAIFIETLNCGIGMPVVIPTMTLEAGLEMHFYEIKLSSIKSSVHLPCQKKMSMANITPAVAITYRTCFLVIVLARRFHFRR